MEIYAVIYRWKVKSADMILQALVLVHIIISLQARPSAAECFRLVVGLSMDGLNSPHSSLSAKAALVLFARMRYVR